MRIGVDLGGSKIEIIVLGDDGDVLLRERVATPQGDYASTLGAVVELVAAAEKRVGAGATVGVGIPGAESRVTGLIKNANSTCLIGKPLKRDLEAALGRDVRLANDANCFALSEAVDGAGAGAQTVFGVILGTGVGGGIVIDGKVLTGANAIAGEWGHNPMPGEHHKDVCYCGRKGCIELYLSGPALARDHRRVAGADFFRGCNNQPGDGRQRRCVVTLRRRHALAQQDVAIVAEDDDLDLAAAEVDADAHQVLCRITCRTIP